MLAKVNMVMGKLTVHYLLVFHPECPNRYFNNLMAFNINNSELIPLGNPFPRQALHGQWEMA